MSAETSAITWKEVAPQTAWEVRIDPVRVHITTAHIYYRGKWSCQVIPLTREARELLGVIPDDLPGAQAAALKMAEEILKPYADAYSVIAEDGGAKGGAR